MGEQLGARANKNVLRRPVSELDPAHVVGAVTIALAVLHGAIALELMVRVHFPDRAFGDLAQFWELGRAAGRPYVDYEASYPVLTVALFKLVAWVASSADGFSRLMIVVNLMADLGVAAIVWRTWGRRATTFYLVAATPMLGLVLTRADAISTVFAVAGVSWWVRERPVRAGALIGFAAMTKLWPSIFAVLGLTRGWTEAAKRFTLSLIVTAGSLGAAWLAFGGLDGVRQVFTYRGAKGWEIETIAGLFIHARHPNELVLSGGAWRVGDVGIVGPVLAIVSVALAAIAVFVGARVDRLGLGWTTGVTSLLVLSTLLSPQFLVWLLPGAAICWVEGNRRIACAVAGAALLTGVEMERLDWLLDARPAWIVLVAVRNAVLVGVALAGAIELSRAARRSERKPTDEMRQ